MNLIDHASQERASMHNTYLLTWNPTRWEWDDLAADARRATDGDCVKTRWSSGNTKRIVQGDRIFLMRLGADPRGIVASGVACGEPEADVHWEDERAAQGDTALFVETAFDWLLDPATTPPLDYAQIQERLPNFRWAPQASGLQIPADLAQELEVMWLNHVGAAAVDGDPELAAYEGQLQLRVVRHRRREQRLRREKIQATLKATGRLECEVPGCGFDFEKAYGGAASGFAHVHHLEPLASLELPRLTTLEQLAVVCANCHAFIHLRGGCRPLSDLLIAARR
jgi:5-methylcytosine-specific restriction enzyme A